MKITCLKVLITTKSQEKIDLYESYQYFFPFSVYFIFFIQ